MTSTYDFSATNTNINNTIAIQLERETIWRYIMSNINRMDIVQCASILRVFLTDENKQYVAEGVAIKLWQYLQSGTVPTSTNEKGKLMDITMVIHGLEPKFTHCMYSVCMYLTLTAIRKYKNLPIMLYFPNRFWW